MITINEQIALLRKQKGITQEGLAQALGVTNQAVSKWESSQSCPDIGLLPEIAKYFKVSIDELLGHKNMDTSQDIVSQLHSTLSFLPEKEAFQLALKAAYVAHASIFAKYMEPDNLGFDATECAEHAANAEWGLSCITLPEITTYMRMGSVFFSNNKNFNLNSSKMKAICKLLKSFSDIQNLKTMVSIYQLTVQEETAYASIEQISEQSLLSEETVRACTEGALSEYLTEKYDTANPQYRIEGSHMHLVPLLAMFSNIG